MTQKCEVICGGKDKKTKFEMCRNEDGKITQMKKIGKCD
jgi:surface antigen